MSNAEASKWIENLYGNSRAMTERSILPVNTSEYKNDLETQRVLIASSFSAVKGCSHQVHVPPASNLSDVIAIIKQ